MRETPLRPRRDALLASSVGVVSLIVSACSQLPSQPPAPAETLFGTNLWQAPGESRAQAARRVDATYGPVDVVRVFSEWLPPSWRYLERDIGERPVVVSFRLPPERILSGRADERLTAWFRAAPTDRDTYWVYFHEPEDQSERGDFSPEEFSAAWRHVALLADAVDNPRLRATVILMCWTVAERSGRDWRSYVPDDGVDVLAWDCYAKGSSAESYADVSTLLDPARAASASIGAEWAIGELGARLAQGADGADRAAWLEEVGAYARHHRARFVAYFDAPIGGAFRLTDRPSIAAWARLVAAAERPSPPGTPDEHGGVR